MARDDNSLVALQAGKPAPRGAGRGNGKAGPPEHETSMAGGGGNGSAAPGDAAPGTDGAAEPVQTNNAASRRADAAHHSAEGGAGTESASLSEVPDAAPQPSKACVSGTCAAALNGPAGLASAAGLDVSSQSGCEPDSVHAASATEPEHSQRQRGGSNTALTAVSGSRQVIAAASGGEPPARGGERTRTPAKLAPSSTDVAHAARAGAVPVWTTPPHAEPQNVSAGEKSTVPVSTAVVRATPASKAVIVHKPSVETGTPQRPPPLQRQQQQRRIADGVEVRPTTAEARPNDPIAAGNKSDANGNASERLDRASLLEIGPDGPTASQQGAAHADGDDGGQAGDQAEKCVHLPYTWSQASMAASAARCPRCTPAVPFVHA